MRGRHPHALHNRRALPALPRQPAAVIWAWVACSANLARICLRLNFSGPLWTYCGPRRRCPHACHARGRGPARPRHLCWTAAPASSSLQSYPLIHHIQPVTRAGWCQPAWTPTSQRDPGGPDRRGPTTASATRASATADARLALGAPSCRVSSRGSRGGRPCVCPRSVLLQQYYLRTVEHWQSAWRGQNYH